MSGAPATPGDTLPHGSAGSGTTEPSARSRRGWWRSNRLALLAVVLLLPATAGIVGGYEWYDYYSGRPSIPVLPDEDGIVDFAGADWGPAKAIVVEDTTGLDVPTGATLIAASVPVAPHNSHGEPGAVACKSPRLVQQSTGRQWDEVSSQVGLDYDSDASPHCSGKGPGPFRVIVVFAVPDDVEGPFWLDVDTFGNYPSFPRLSIDP